MSDASFRNLGAAMRERDRRIGLSLASPGTPGVAQAGYLMPSWDAFYGSQRERAGPGGYRLSGAGSSLGGDPSGSTERPGEADSAQSLAVNDYLARVTDEQRQRVQTQKDMADHNQAVFQAEADRSTGQRALAIANTPGVSATGAPIVPGSVRGQAGLVTGAPTGEPVNRQAVASQMAPGVIAPPAPVTYGKPEKMTVAGPGGKPTDSWVRMGSDGLPYDMARRPMDPSTIGVPVATSTANTEAKDALIEEAAKNILANPRDLTSLKSVASLQGDQRLKLFNALKRDNPDFNVGNIDRQVKFLDSYEDPKGRAATNRGSMNNILMHAADLSDANQEYRRSDARVLNMPIAVLQRQGGTAWQQFATPLAVLKDEIGLYFAGGYAPTAEQGKTWDKIVNDTATPAQVEQFAKDIAHIGLRRADTHNQQFKTMMGYDDPNLITPEAKAAAEHIGMGEAVKKYGSGGTIGTKPPASAQAGGTVEMIAPDGGILDVPAGEVDALMKAHPDLKRRK